MHGSLWGWLSGWLEFRGFIRQDMCVWPPKKKGAAVGGGRKTPPCKRDAGVEAAANEHANAHKYIYTPTHSGEEENISSSNLVYNKSNFITLFFMHATGYMASVWLTDEHTNTQDPHTHKRTALRFSKLI